MPILLDLKRIHLAARFSRQDKDNGNWHAQQPVFTLSTVDDDEDFNDFISLAGSSCVEAWEAALATERLDSDLVRFATEHLKRKFPLLEINPPVSTESTNSAVVPGPPSQVSFEFIAQSRNEIDRQRLGDFCPVMGRVDGVAEEEQNDPHTEQSKGELINVPISRFNEESLQENGGHSLFRRLSPGSTGTSDFGQSSQSDSSVSPLLSHNSRGSLPERSADYTDFRNTYVPIGDADLYSESDIPGDQSPTSHRRRYGSGSSTSQS